MNLVFWTLCCLPLIFGISYGLTAIPTFKLRDGNKIPAVGFGTFGLSSEQVHTSVTAALENGCRHIDTAFMYFNEKDIGDTLETWLEKGGKREDLFITAKLPFLALRSSDVAKALELTLTNMRLRYIDNYLIHVPFGVHRTPDFKPLTNANGTISIDYSTDLIAVWKEMEKLVKAGKVKSIGLSNFNKTQILKIWKNAEIKPTNLQIETNVYIQQEELAKLCHKLGIVMTAYSPLGSGDTIHMRRRKRDIVLPSPIQHPVVQKIASQHNKSPAQVLLRYNVQRNIVVIPKSTNPKRIQENLDIFDFKLTKSEMKQLKALDQHGKYRKFDFLSFAGIEHHPEYPFADRTTKKIF